MIRSLVTMFALALATLPSLAARAELPGEGYKNHLVISLGFGFDSIHPTDYDAYTNAFDQFAGGTSGQINPTIAMHASLLATYYAPYYILVRTGVDPDYFFPQGKVGNDTVTNYGGTLEVPLMVGGHYAMVEDRLIVELAAGPCISAFTSAGLSGGSGITAYQQLQASPSFGFDSELKGQFFVSHGFSLGLEVGYRILSSNALHISGQSGYYQPPFPPFDEPGGGKPIHLDLSGFRAELDLGFLAF